MATHLGCVDENAIDNMSIVFFEDILEALGNRLIYEAISNYAGNSFAKDSWEMIMDHYPMNNQSPGVKGNKNLADFFNKSDIQISEKVDLSRMPQTYKERRVKDE